MPRSITVDHGTEFTSRALEDWAYGRGVQLDFTGQDRSMAARLQSAPSTQLSREPDPRWSFSARYPSAVRFQGPSISRNSRSLSRSSLAGRLVTDRAAQDRRAGQEERKLVSCWRSHPRGAHANDREGRPRRLTDPSSSGERGRKDCLPRVLRVPSEPGATSIERDHADVTVSYPVTCGPHVGLVRRHHTFTPYESNRIEQNLGVETELRPGGNFTEKG